MEPNQHSTGTKTSWITEEISKTKPQWIIWIIRKLNPFSVPLAANLQTIAECSTLHNQTNLTQLEA